MAHNIPTRKRDNIIYVDWLSWVRNESNELPVVFGKLFAQHWPLLLSRSRPLQSHRTLMATFQTAPNCGAPTFTISWTEWMTGLLREPFLGISVERSIIIYRGLCRTMSSSTCINRVVSSSSVRLTSMVQCVSVCVLYGQRLWANIRELSWDFEANQSFLIIRENAWESCCSEFFVAHLIKSSPFRIRRGIDWASGSNHSPDSNQLYVCPLPTQRISSINYHGK